MCVCILLSSPSLSTFLSIPSFRPFLVTHQIKRLWILDNKVDEIREERGRLEEGEGRREVEEVWDKGGGNTRMGEEDTGATNKTWFGKEFVAGSIAGASGVVFGHPLDTIKTRLQVVGSGSSSSKPNQYTSTTSAMFKHMSRKEGFGSFFRGLSWPLLSKSIEQCLIFGLNEECRKRLPLEGEALIVAAGAVAGGLGMGILTPVYVVKVQLQIPPRERVGNFRGPIQCAAFNFHKYGMKGLYAGLLPSLIANPICYGVRFITYVSDFSCMLCSALHFD